jgi:hypothetical protein
VLIDQGGPYSTKRSPGTVDASIINIWDTARRLLFPSLRYLNLWLPGRQDIALCRFFSPSITHLAVEISQSGDVEDPISYFPDHIAELGSGLKSLKMDFRGPWRDGAVQQLIVMFPSQAREITTLTIQNQPLSYSCISLLAARPALRFLEAPSLLADGSTQFPPGCFPALESITVSNLGSSTEFVREFLARASAPGLVEANFTVDTIDPVYSTSMADCLSVIQGFSRFSRMKRIDLAFNVPDTGESRRTIIMAVLAAFEHMSFLTFLRVECHIPLLFPTPEHFLGHRYHWPALRILYLTSDNVARPSIALSTFFHVLLACPLLIMFSGVIECSLLPSDELVARLAQLQHPYNYVFHAVSITQVEGLASILHQALPKMNIMYFHSGSDRAIGAVIEQLHRLKNGTAL